MYTFFFQLSTHSPAISSSTTNNGGGGSNSNPTKQYQLLCTGFFSFSSKSWLPFSSYFSLRFSFYQDRRNVIDIAINMVDISKRENLESICRDIYNSCEEEKLLTHVLVSSTQTECRKLREMYTKIYGEDLIHLYQKLDSKASYFSRMMQNPYERDAGFVREALHKNDAVDYEALMETLTCRKSSHVLLILQSYHLSYGTKLDVDIVSVEPPHPYQKILMALSASHKSHHAEISLHIAKCDARRLYETGEGKPGAVDEAVVLEVLSKRSIAQMKLTFYSYKRIYGTSYTSFLKNGNFGEFEDAVRVVSKCICNPPRYFAKALFQCLKGGTSKNNGSMSRIMLTRAEVGMDDIRKEFNRKYQLDLKTIILETVPEGIQRDILVSLANKQ